MIRATGFLVGVCLTVAAFLLLLNTGERRQPGVSGDGMTVEPSGLSADIVAQAEVVQDVNESDQAVPPVQESETTDGETKSGLLEATGGDTVEESSGVSTAIVAQADVAQAVNQAEEAVPPAHDTGAADVETPSDVEASGPEQGGALDVQAETANDSDPQDSGDNSTYLFWSPFRSAWAAQGFASRLTSATQVPVEVVNTGPGKYRAAFSYQDESERLARIERIETITGLKLE